MQPVEFELSIPAMERPQIYAIERVAAGIVCGCFSRLKFLDRSKIAVSRNSVN